MPPRPSGWKRWMKPKISSSIRAMPVTAALQGLKNELLVLRHFVQSRVHAHHHLDSSFHQLARGFQTLIEFGSPLFGFLPALLGLFPARILALLGLVHALLGAIHTELERRLAPCKSGFYFGIHSPAVYQLELHLRSFLRRGIRFEIRVLTLEIEHGSRDILGEQRDIGVVLLHRLVVSPA